MIKQYVCPHAKFVRGNHKETEISTTVHNAIIWTPDCPTQALSVRVGGSYFCEDRQVPLFDF